MDRHTRNVCITWQIRLFPKISLEVECWGATLTLQLKIWPTTRSRDFYLFFLLNNYFSRASLKENVEMFGGTPFGSSLFRSVTIEWPTFFNSFGVCCCKKKKKNPPFFKRNRNCFFRLTDSYSWMNNNKASLLYFFTRQSTVQRGEGCYWLKLAFYRGGWPEDKSGSNLRLTFPRFFLWNMLPDGHCLCGIRRARLVSPTIISSCTATHAHLKKQQNRMTMSFHWMPHFFWFKDHIFCFRKKQKNKQK